MIKQAHLYRTNGKKPVYTAELLELNVQAVLLVSRDGKRTDKIQSELQTFYNLDDARAFCDNFPAQLEMAERRLNQGG